MPDRGENAASTAARRLRRTAGNMAERNATLGQVVRGHLERDFVAGEDADVVFAHFPGGISDHVVTIVQRYAKTRIRQDFVNGTVHFNEFFLGQY